MSGKESRAEPDRARRGLGGWDIGLGLVVAALLWLVVPPQLEHRRDARALDAMRDEARRLVMAAEDFRVREGRYPVDLDELRRGGAAASAGGVQVCVLAGTSTEGDGVPRLHLIVGHPRSTRVVGSLRPQWGDELAELETGLTGCDAYGEPGR